MKFWLFICKFRKLKLFLKMFHHRHLLVTFTTARVLKILGELSEIHDSGHSVTEAAMKRSFLK